MVEARIHDEWCPLYGNYSVMVGTDPVGDQALLDGLMVRVTATVEHPSLGPLTIHPRMHAWRLT